MSIFTEIGGRMFQLVIAPLHNPSMLWAAVPLMASLAIITFYYAKYPEEEQGWENAVSNTLVLIFVGVDLLRYVYTNPQVEDIIRLSGIPLPAKTFAALLVLFLGVSLLVITYNHIHAKGVTFAFASPVTVNVMAYVAMAVVYSNIALDYRTLLAGIVMGLIIYIIVKLAIRGMPKKLFWLGKKRK